jgi:hypothetical protein
MSDGKKPMSNLGQQLFDMMGGASLGAFSVTDHRGRPTASKPYRRRMDEAMDERSIAQARMDYEVGEMEAREFERMGNDSAYNAHEDNSTDHYDAYPEEGY